MVNFIKRAVKWYCYRVSETYTMTPTGMIPNRKVSD